MLQFVNTKTDFMKKVLACIVLLMFFLSPQNLWAQNSISGKVVDAQNNPLAGATVTVRGTNVSTQTDVNGNFTITTPNANSRLTVSYVGYAGQTVDGSGSNMNILGRFLEL